MFRVYLSGSMSGRLAEQVKEERALAIRKFKKAGILAVDPGASEDKLWGKQRKAKISLRYPEKIIKAFVEQDKWLIRRCDALLVMTGDTPSDGTWREMSFAEKIEIPVIMIAPKRINGELVGWSNIEVPYVVSDLDSAVKFVKKKLVPKYEAHKSYFDTAIKNAEGIVGSMSKKKRRKRKIRRKVKGRRHGTRRNSTKK